MVGRLEMIEREPEHQKGFSCYQDTICGPRSMTAVELHSIPRLVDTFGLAAFCEIVTVAGNKGELGSPIRYVEVALEKQAKRELREAQSAVNEIAREAEGEAFIREPWTPAREEHRREVLERAAADGNVVAADTLRREQ